MNTILPRENAGPNSFRDNFYFSKKKIDSVMSLSLTFVLIIDFLNSSFMGGLENGVFVPTIPMTLSIFKTFKMMTLERPKDHN